MVLEGKERQKGPEKTFEEIIAEKFPNMGQDNIKYTTFACKWSWKEKRDRKDLRKHLKR